MDMLALLKVGLCTGLVHTAAGMVLPMLLQGATPMVILDARTQLVESYVVNSAGGAAGASLASLLGVQISGGPFQGLF